MGCHLPRGITHEISRHKWTQFNTPRRNPSQIGRYSIYLPRWDGRLRWLITCRDDPHRPNTNPTVHSRELNSQHVDHKSDALTVTLPSHPSRQHVWCQIRAPFAPTSSLLQYSERRSLLIDIRDHHWLSLDWYITSISPTSAANGRHDAATVTASPTGLTDWAPPDIVGL